MEVRVGTSGFSYAEWRGSFYPEKHPPKKMLSYYAERFSTVEINATFYRMPKPSMLEGWLTEVPSGFTFVLKVPLAVTMAMQKRPEHALAMAEIFCGVATTLGPRLGPLLFQLPPHVKKDLPMLEAFFAKVPRPSPLVVEFGDPSWFSEDVYAWLESHEVAGCFVDGTDEKRAFPFVKTAPHGYLRLRKVDYADAELDAWAERIRGAGWDTAHVFFKHEDAATGPVLARKLVDALGRAPKPEGRPTKGRAAPRRGDAATKQDPARSPKAR